MSETPRPELVVDGFPGKRPPALDRARDQRRPQGPRPHPDLRRPRLPLHRPDRDAADAAAAGDPGEHLPLPGRLQPDALRSTAPTAIFFFAIPLALGLFYYVAPLQIGARGTALPRLGQIGVALWVAGATVLYAGFLFTPSEAGVNPLAAAHRARLPLQQRRRRLGHRDRPLHARLRLHRDRPADDAAQHAGAGHGLAPGPGLRLGRHRRLLAAAGHRPGPAGGADDADDRPQLRRHLLRRRLRRRAAALAAPELDLLLRRLHADPDLRLRRDRRNRRRLLRQAALQPRRRRWARWRRSPCSAPWPGCRTC